MWSRLGLCLIVSILFEGLEADRSYQDLSLILLDEFRYESLFARQVRRTTLLALF